MAKKRNATTKKVEEFIRRPDKISGPITEEERVKLKAHTDEWIKIAYRTDPIVPDIIIPAIKALYAAADLKTVPVVAIASSPLTMAYAYGAVRAILEDKVEVPEIRSFPTDRPAYAQVFRIVADVLGQLGKSFTYETTVREGKTFKHAGAAAKQACFDIAGDAGIKKANDWSNNFQGGNMGAKQDCYLTAMRDVMGLKYESQEKYATWETCARHGSFRVLHKKFCIVSDFPRLITVDEEQRPHNASGPSHMWSDGWSFYHWHGERVTLEELQKRSNESA